MLKSLSKYCRHLESLCFQEPSSEISLLGRDILPILFGISLGPDQTDYNTLLTRFAKEKDFREKFEPQFPNLKKLDLDELYFEEELLHSVYTLALLLQPKLQCFGRHTGLTRRILSKYRRLWTIMNDCSSDQINLCITKVKFVDSVFDAAGDAETELQYLEEIVPMFKSLKSVELIKDHWNETDVVKFIQIFARSVDAFSLSSLPVNNLACLNNVVHLRLTLCQRYSFEQIHAILDNCTNLQTLSIHPALCLEHPPNNRNQNQLLVFGQMMAEDQRILENLMIAEIAADMPEMGRLLEGGIEENPEGVGDEAGLGARANAPNLRPSPRNDRTFKKKFQAHTKLLTLRLPSVFEAPQESSEVSEIFFSLK